MVSVFEYYAALFIYEWFTDNMKEFKKKCRIRALLISTVLITTMTAGCFSGKDTDIDDQEIQMEMIDEGNMITEDDTIAEDMQNNESLETTNSGTGLEAVSDDIAPVEEGYQDPDVENTISSEPSENPNDNQYSDDEGEFSDFDEDSPTDLYEDDQSLFENDDIWTDDTDMGEFDPIP